MGFGLEDIALVMLVKQLKRLNKGKIKWLQLQLQVLQEQDKVLQV